MRIKNLELIKQRFDTPQNKDLSFYKTKEPISQNWKGQPIWIKHILKEIIILLIFLNDI